MKKSGKVQKIFKMILILLSISPHTIKSWENSSKHIESSLTDHHHYTDKKTCKITLQKGDTGLQGPQGLKGPRGISGEEGEVGVVGEAGNIGLSGDIGPMGPSGEVGVDGKNIKGRNGPKGDKGVDVQEIICLCQDNIYFYFCCLVDNKHDTSKCDKARAGVKACEDKCNVTEDKEEKFCELQETDCKIKCDTKVLDGSSFNNCIGIGVGPLKNIDDILTACKNSCTSLKKTCLSKRGCMKEQEQKCIDKCPKEVITKNLNCKSNCLFAKNETYYQETCDDLFPVYNPYNLYTIQDNETNKCLAGGLFPASPGPAFRTWFITIPNFPVDWLFLKSDEGYMIVNCFKPPSPFFFFSRFCFKCF